MNEWTDVHQKQARAEGWELATTFDNDGRGVAYLSIRGLRKSDDDTRKFVLAQAKRLSPLHINAVRIMLNSKVNVHTA